MNAEGKRDNSGIEGEAATDEAPAAEPTMAELEEARRELEQFRNLVQRVQADSLNYKRRVEEEREELQKRANANLVIRLLPVLDDFERALDHAPDSGDQGSWLSGVEMVYRNLMGVLNSFGVTQIEAVGKTFDPQEHESIYYEATNEHEEGKVISVVRAGYKLHGWVLRPTQVSVSKRKDGESSPSGELDSSWKETE